MGDTYGEVRIKLEKVDGRGEIYSIDLGDGEEVMLLRSVAGSVRGGHSHNVDEVVVLLSGAMEYRRIVAEGIGEEREMEAGEISWNPAGVPHMARFLEESWVMEKKLCRKGEWKDEEYGPWRELVRESMEAS